MLVQASFTKTFLIQIEVATTRQLHRDPPPSKQKTPDVVEESLGFGDRIGVARNEHSDPSPKPRFGIPIAE